MGDPERLRDSTQIVLPAGSLEPVDADLDEEYAVTVTRADGRVRIVGSPVVIKEVGDLLARNGVSLP